MTQTSNNNLFASIDMGTNSFKLLIVQADPSPSLPKFLPILRHKHPVCLGRNESTTSTNTAISAASQHRAIQSLNHFSQILKSHNVPFHHLRCVATAAVRDADNRTGFIDAVLESTGLNIAVLSGEEEARYVYLGMIQLLPVCDKRVLVIDIGGGSTEFVIGEGGHVVFGISLKLGHVDLTQKFVTNDGFGSYMKMREFVKLVINESGLVEKIRGYGGFELVVGTSGTIRAIERAVLYGYGENLSDNDNSEVLFRDFRRDWKFSRGELKTFVERLCRQEEEGERVKRYEFFKRRSEFIISGAVLLEEIFEVLGIEEMEVSRYGLGEGVVVEMLDKVFEGYDLNANARWGSVLRLVMRFSDKKRINSAAQCASIAKEIFEGVRKWSEVVDNQVNLCLDEKDLEHLEAACLLHNIGLLTGKKGYHKQSYRIIMNGDHLHGYNAEEVKLIALLTRHHRKKFPKFDGATLKDIPEQLKQKFRFLCAIIRVSVVLQQNDGLNFQNMEFFHSQEGLKLVFRKVTDQSNLPLKEDIGEELRKELEHFNLVFQQQVLVEVLSCSSELLER